MSEPSPSEPSPPAPARIKPQRRPVTNGRHDVFTHRLVVIFLGLAVIFTGANMTILQCLGREPSAALTNLGATAIGALALALGHIMGSK